MRGLARPVDDRLRILVVTQYFRPENFRVNDLVDWLREQRHEVVVLTGMPNYPAGRLFDGYSVLGPWTESVSGVMVVRVPLIPRGKGGGLRLALNYFSFALAASILGPFRCKGRFDAIFVHEPSPITVGIPAAVLRAVKKSPVLFWVLDLWPESLEATGAVRSPRILAMVDRLVAWIFRHCDWVLIQSRAFAGRICHHGVDPRRLLYFPNWAEPVLGSRASAGQRGDFPELPEGFRVVYTGNIGAAQDFPTVLAAAELLQGQRDVHWVLVGGGREADWVRGEVRRRGLESQVHMMGSYAPDMMPAFFAAADALLVSLRAEPIFALTVPAKVQAYLVAGRPILAALDGEGASIVTESGAGLACPAGDAARLAERVLELRAMTPEARDAMGQRGREYSTLHFDRETLLRRLEGWLRGDGLPQGEPTRTD